jgi:hypothetical protein
MFGPKCCQQMMPPVAGSVAIYGAQPRAARLGGLRARVDADATTTLRLGDDSRAVAFA